ncbi:hypothetical protein diail_495 [Diaporthe ilicicola]|nr:hypothetical protein diail_495 [Diaporthe ilicicola]
MRDSARSVLYETVDIRRLDTLSLFARTVSGNPALGGHVRELRLKIFICGRSDSRGVCNDLYTVLDRTSNLQVLRLRLEECRCPRAISFENFAVNGADVSYDGFFRRVADRTRRGLNSRRGNQTFLSRLRDFHFTSNDIPYPYCAFFSIPSLRHIISTKDTGEWDTILSTAHGLGTHNPYRHVRKFTLKSSAIVPSQLYSICRSFPNLEVLKVRNNPRMTHLLFRGTPVAHPVDLDQLNLSTALAQLTEVKELTLDLGYPSGYGPFVVDLPRFLGPAGGITGLSGLRNLTQLTIGMNHLMCYRGNNFQDPPLPLPPRVLPPLVERLRLYTCISCWCNDIGRFWQAASQISIPSTSTFHFVRELVAWLCANNAALPALRSIRLYSQSAWWVGHGSNWRWVMHCPEEMGQVWNAGGFEQECGISRLENRAGGRRIHFRAYQSTDLDCGYEHPDDEVCIHKMKISSNLSRFTTAAMGLLATTAQAQNSSSTIGPETGSLVIVGGGSLSDNIYQRVIDLAGGSGAAIVVIPTADGADSYDQDAAGAAAFRRLGAGNVTVLHTYDRAVADTEGFVAPLLEAQGVWFGGGRQWRLVDAYAGTRAEAAFAEVLARGGVIGGSSAGASIQGSFLARGDTANNQVMVGDHQAGFGYIRDTAIDQHVLVRNRVFDMFDILKVRPELLGFGIDENTALVVSGNEAEVIGASYVAVYDGGFWSREGSDLKNLPGSSAIFYYLRNGDRYDLGARRVIEGEGATPPT